MKRHFKLSVAVVAACLVPITAAANDEWEQQVRAQLGAAQLMMEEEGMTRFGAIEYDTMTNSEVDNFTVTLTRGTTYKMIGACDNDCRDIDFWLYDEDDNEIDKDISDDDVPVVEVTPKWTGEFRLKVRMYDCRNEPCRHGILIMED